MTNNKPVVSLQAYIRSGSVQSRIESLLGNRSSEFTTSLMSLVNSNPVLQDCPPDSVIKAAITSAAMNLPINPNLGFAYIIPYKNNKSGGYEAQFQMGYKGFIQLAQRSGQFKRINATDVREGELLGVNRLSGELNIEWIENEKERNAKPVVGYIGYFKLLNGFEKELYMTVEELQSHGKKYSQSFKRGYGLWADEFDTMAKKTVLKLLISKYGALTTNLQEAILADQSAVGEDGYNYIDNDKGSDSEVKETPSDPPKQVEDGDKGNPKPAKGSEEPSKLSPRKEVAK